jgi:hypothetical protein
VGLALGITYYLLFVPVSTFSSRFLVGGGGSLFVLVVASMMLHLLLIMYSCSMLTTCYPNEKIPWAHFPSRVPFYKLAVRLPIVLAYQLDLPARENLIYCNACFAGVMLLFVAARLT